MAKAKPLRNNDELQFYLRELKNWQPPSFDDPHYGKCYRGDFLLLQELVQRLRVTAVTVDEVRK